MWHGKRARGPATGGRHVCNGRPIIVPIIVPISVPIIVPAVGTYRSCAAPPSAQLLRANHVQSPQALCKIPILLHALAVDKGWVKDDPEYFEDILEINGGKADLAAELRKEVAEGDITREPRPVPRNQIRGSAHHSPIIRSSVRVYSVFTQSRSSDEFRRASSRQGVSWWRSCTRRNCR